jgi:hypothetical protein
MRKQGPKLAVRLCGKMLTNWDERTWNVSKPFRDGCGMHDWSSAGYWKWMEVVGVTKLLLEKLKGLVSAKWMRSKSKDN